ncbi:MAG: hypothetical protein AVDCRST_MAG77-3886, partial [uncultured Chloroflexi bacterium]
PLRLEPVWRISLTCRVVSQRPQAHRGLDGRAHGPKRLARHSLHDGRL